MRVDWIGGLVSTAVGLVLGGLILLAMGLRNRQRLRADPSLAAAPITARENAKRAKQVGWCAAVAATGLAAFVGFVGGGAHAARDFFGFLLVEAALLAFYGFAFAPNEELPDVSAGRYREMKYSERLGVLHTYGAGRAARSMRVAARVLTAIGLPGLLVALVVG